MRALFEAVTCSAEGKVGECVTVETGLGRAIC